MNETNFSVNQPPASNFPSPPMATAKTPDNVPKPQTNTTNNTTSKYMQLKQGVSVLAKKISNLISLVFDKALGIEAPKTTTVPIQNQKMLALITKNLDVCNGLLNQIPIRNRGFLTDNLKALKADFAKTRKNPHDLVALNQFNQRLKSFYSILESKVPKS